MKGTYFCSVLEYAFDVLAFTEASFSDNINVFQFHGYNCEPVYRAGRRGGGVAHYLADHLPYVVIPEFTDKFEQRIFDVKCFKTIIAVMYCSP